MSIRKNSKYIYVLPCVLFSEQGLSGKSIKEIIQPVTFFFVETTSKMPSSELRWIVKTDACFKAPPQLTVEPDH